MIQRCGCFPLPERTAKGCFSPGNIKTFFRQNQLKSFVYKRLQLILQDIFLLLTNKTYAYSTQNRVVVTLWYRQKKNAALVCAAFGFPVYNLMKSFKTVVNNSCRIFHFHRRSFLLTVQKCSTPYHLQKTKNGIC